MRATGPATVAVLGEALVDLIVDVDGSVVATPGGGPFNAARTFARLGGDAVFLGRLSQDRFGLTLRTRLLGDGVRLGGLGPTAVPTTLAVAELDAAGAATYRFYVQSTSAGDLAIEDALAEITPQMAVIHVGTLGLVLEPLASTVEAVVQSARPDVLVFVDPNCRPGVIRDRQAYLLRLQRILHRSDVVKVSGDDLAYLAPGTPPDQVAHSLLERGARVVLFTDGGSAVKIFAAGIETSVAVPQISVIDTVGAGDAFGAGFLHWWTDHGLGRADLGDEAALVAAASAGSQVAGLTCERAGAEPPTQQEVLTRFPTVARLQH